MTWESCGSQRGRGKRRAVHCSGYRRRLTRLCPTELEFECKDLPGQFHAGNACSRPALRRTARGITMRADCCMRDQAGAIVAVGTRAVRKMMRTYSTRRKA